MRSVLPMSMRIISAGWGCLPGSTGCRSMRRKGRWKPSDMLRPWGRLTSRSFGLLRRMRNVSSRISPCIPYAPPTMPPTRWPTGSAMTGGGSGFSRIWAVIRTIPWNVCGIWIYCIWKQITMCICCRWDLIPTT